MWRILLLALTAFSVVSAAAGFLYLGPAGAPGWPVEYLSGSPFTNYFWPAVILLVVVGGTQAAAFVLLLRRSGSALFWSAVAGYGMTIWILVEQFLFRVPDYDAEWVLVPVLQSLYAAVGLAELGCTLVLLGLFRPDTVRAALAAGKYGSRRNATQ